MASMKAIQVRAPGAGFELVRVPVPEPQPNEVLIRVEACGVCHGDVLPGEGRFPGIKYPVIPGHEVVGIIDRVGPGTAGWSPGQRVGVGWHGGHCFHCRACRRGDFGACENSLTTGLSTDGGYAEYMVARAEVLTAIPDGLDPVVAAPLLCAGRTTFGALRGSGARGGDLVAVHGLGGLGHLAVQYALKMGFQTAVISRSPEKKDLAGQLGAHVFLDAGAMDPAAELKALGGAQVILATAPNGKAISGLIGGLSRHGKLIVITAPPDPVLIPPFLLLGGTRSVGGWVGGGIEETIRFSMLFHVTPMVEVFPLEEAASAFEKMMTGKVHFRAVLTP